MTNALIEDLDRDVDEVDPSEAWRLLEADAHAVLIDVRTDAEWRYVGMPDLSALGKQPIQVSWQLFPDMRVNLEFEDELASHGARRAQTLLFICRSGVRSRLAAELMAEAGYECCYNVAEGFEGDKDELGQRGSRNGWKVHGLPWKQS